MRGVHFAISDDQAAAVRAARGDDDAVTARIDAIEDAWDEAWLAESDTAWDALPDAARPGEALFGDERAYERAILIEPACVVDAAKQLALVVEHTVEDRTWAYLVDVRALFMKAARAGRHVLFSAR